MRKLIFLPLIIVLIISITRCIGLGYSKIPLLNVKCSTENERFYFYIQGFTGREGSGNIQINDRIIPVKVLIVIVGRASLLVYTYNEELNGLEELIHFYIELYSPRNSSDHTKILLSLHKNFSNDNSYDEQFDIFRTNLTEEEQDTKYYVNVKWENANYGIRTLKDEITTINHINYGKITNINTELGIEFHF